MMVSIFNCGHSYHFSCLDLTESDFKKFDKFQSAIPCPACNFYSVNTFRGGIRQTNLNIKSNNSKKSHGVKNSLSASDLKELAKGYKLNDDQSTIGKNF